MVLCSWAGPRVSLPSPTCTSPMSHRLWPPATTPLDAARYRLLEPRAITSLTRAHRPIDAQLFKTSTPPRPIFSHSCARAPFFILSTLKHPSAFHRRLGAICPHGCWTATPDLKPPLPWITLLHLAPPPLPFFIH
jgi:hypothetical protein